MYILRKYCTTLPFASNKKLFYQQRILQNNRKMSSEEIEVFQPPPHIQASAHCKSMQDYKAMYKDSIENPAEFWHKIAQTFHWKKPPSLENFYYYNFNAQRAPIGIRWMGDGVMNVCYNVLDRNVHEKNLGDKIAFYWEGNDPNDISKITYAELLKEVCKFSNVLKSKGLIRGDRVAIYMPMILQLIVAMLACARLGLIHSIVFGGYSKESLGNRIQAARASVVITTDEMSSWLQCKFGGFSVTALKDRLLDTQCNVLVTADGTWRGDKLLNIKEVADGAIEQCSLNGFNVDHCIVVRHATTDQNAGDGDGVDKVGCRPTNKIKLSWQPGRDVWYHEEMSKVNDECEVEWMDAEDPLFILYTSGSTGRPKGVLHSQAGYLIYVATTFKYVFDYKPDDVFFCTADIGWITGHSYVCYGPMANGATSVIFEGVPFFPDSSRYWQIVDKYKVNKFYTAPTAIRALMKFGDEFVKKCDRSSLEILGSVGEPINSEAWMWYHEVVGGGRCVVVDTFWQTETGGHVITPLPGATPTKPGSATFPFFGIEPILLSEDGRVIEGQGEGHLAFKRPWPGIMRTVYENHRQFEASYFKKFPGYYTCGDGARRDEDGYLWITGRIDDMLNVSGHLISTAEVESVLGHHPSIIESAVVAKPHKVKGECLYCFVTLKNGEKFDKELVASIKNLVRVRMAPFAQPDYIQEAPSLPKTRSGKIMRRILRLVAIGDRNLGDTSTLADESIIEELFRLRVE